MKDGTWGYQKDSKFGAERVLGRWIGSRFVLHARYALAVEFIAHDGKDRPEAGLAAYGRFIIV